MPPGIRFVDPAKSQMNAENGYNPDDYLEVELDDPYDVCALTEFNALVSKIVRSEMPERAKLFHVFGEDHTTSAHLMAQASFAATLPAGFVYGHEQPVNDLATYTDIAYDLSLSSLSLEKLKESDPRGHHYARAVITRNLFPEAPLARNYIMQAILDQDGHLANIDAMKKMDGVYIDERDPLLAEIAEAVFPNKRLDLIALSTVYVGGAIIRNFIMARRAFEAAAHHNAQDILIGTGLTHLGNKQDGYDYDHALPAATLQEAEKRGEPGTRVVSLFLASANDNYLLHRIIPPGRAAGHVPIIVHNLAEDEHYGFDPDAERCINRISESFTRRGKAAPNAPRPEPIEMIEAELNALAPAA